MTVDEAIKFLRSEVSVPYSKEDKLLHTAMKLGIEALKRIKLQRQFNLTYQDKSLPGETR